MESANAEAAAQCLEKARSKYDSGEEADAMRWLEKAKSLGGDTADADRLIARMEKYGAKSELGQLVRRVLDARDHYETVGIPRDSFSADQLRKVTKRLKLKLHPDKNQAIGAEDAFKKATEALEVLGDDFRRAQYEHDCVTAKQAKATDARSTTRTPSPQPPANSELLRHVSALRVPEVKELCRKLGQNSVGHKQQLVQRVLEALARVGHNAAQLSRFFLLRDELTEARELEAHLKKVGLNLLETSVDELSVSLKRAKELGISEVVTRKAKALLMTWLQREKEREEEYTRQAAEKQVAEARIAEEQTAKARVKAAAERAARQAGAEAVAAAEAKAVAEAQAVAEAKAVAEAQAVAEAEAVAEARAAAEAQSAARAAAEAQAAAEAAARAQVEAQLHAVEAELAAAREKASASALSDKKALKWLKRRIRGGDLASITPKSLRKELEADLGVDISSRDGWKKWWGALIDTAMRVVEEERQAVQEVEAQEAKDAEEAAAAAAEAAVVEPEPEEEEEEENEEQYEPEEILDERKVGRKTEYLIKWLGYEAADDQTWEPAANMKGTDALKKYNAAKREAAAAAKEAATAARAAEAAAKRKAAEEARRQKGEPQEKSAKTERAKTPANATASASLSRPQRARAVPGRLAEMDSSDEEAEAAIEMGETRPTPATKKTSARAKAQPKMQAADEALTLDDLLAEAAAADEALTLDELLAAAQREGACVGSGAQPSSTASSTTCATASAASDKPKRRAAADSSDDDDDEVMSGDEYVMGCLSGEAASAAAASVGVPLSKQRAPRVSNSCFARGQQDLKRAKVLEKQKRQAELEAAEAEDAPPRWKPPSWMEMQSESDDSDGTIQRKRSMRRKVAEEKKRKLARKATSDAAPRGAADQAAAVLPSTSSHAEEATADAAIEGEEKAGELADVEAAVTGEEAAEEAAGEGGPSAALVQEQPAEEVAPVAEAPVAEAPVAQAPLAQAPVEEAPEEEVRQDEEATLEELAELAESSRGEAGVEAASQGADAEAVAPAAQLDEISIESHREEVSTAEAESPPAPEPSDEVNEGASEPPTDVSKGMPAQNAHDALDAAEDAPPRGMDAALEQRELECSDSAAEAPVGPAIEHIPTAETLAADDIDMADADAAEAASADTAEACKENVWPREQMHAGKVGAAKSPRDGDAEEPPTAKKQKHAAEKHAAEKHTAETHTAGKHSTGKHTAEKKRSMEQPEQLRTKASSKHESKLGPLDAAMVAKAVRAVLRKSPNPLEMSRKDIRLKLESKLGVDMAVWKDTIKSASGDYIKAL